MKESFVQWLQCTVSQLVFVWFLPDVCTFIPYSWHSACLVGPNWTLGLDPPITACRGCVLLCSHTFANIFGPRSYQHKWCTVKYQSFRTQAYHYMFTICCTVYVTNKICICLSHWPIISIIVFLKHDDNRIKKNARGEKLWQSVLTLLSSNIYWAERRRSNQK